MPKVSINLPCKTCITYAICRTHLLEKMRYVNKNLCVIEYGGIQIMSLRCSTFNDEFLKWLKSARDPSSYTYVLNLREDMTRILVEIFDLPTTSPYFRKYPNGL